MDAKIPDCPVVGIGVSATGRDACRQLLSALPDDSGAAFIIIQQQFDSGHRPLTAQLISRDMRLQVVRARAGMTLAPNNIYVLPPDKMLVLADEAMLLDRPSQNGGGRAAIDVFFRSLAEVRGERAIGVLLGGGDGALGAREIKAAGGLVIVQAKDASASAVEPHSAVAAIAADLALRPEEMGRALIDIIRNAKSETAPRETDFAQTEPEHFQTILTLLRAQSNYDFHSYKTGTLERRIRRRMGLKHIGSLESYVRLLQTTPEEVNLLFKDLLIGVTRFYREPEAWAALDCEAIAQLVERKAVGTPLRAWVPGCASGEEAYTLAMVIFDRLDQLRKPLDLQIFATDINEGAIAAARAGVYPMPIATDVPAASLAKYFELDGDNYRVNKRLRETVVFAAQNIISDPPFSKLDLISCRNLMIYLEPNIQQRLVELFHFALAENGYLFFGSAESAERPGRLFEPISKPHRIYRRAAVARLSHGSFPIVPAHERSVVRRQGEISEALQIPGGELATQILLDRFVPASVLVNRRLEAQHYYGPVRNYLDFPNGEPTTDLPAMALDGLRSKLRITLQKALRDQKRSEGIVRGIRREGGDVRVRITAEPVFLPGGTDPHILVYFEDLPAPPDSHEGHAALVSTQEAAPEDGSLVRQLEYELEATKVDLQSTIEEIESANEELKSSNEEIMSMNEELQSANEELETSREELQSLNEELASVNSQLEQKIGEVEATNDDLSNLLTSTQIATIFLDTELRIRRFTSATKDLLRIADGDIGRSIEDLTQRVDDPGLLSDCRRVLERLQPMEAEVRGAEGDDYIRRVHPYRTSDNRIEGVVITFTDVTALREAADRAQRREKQQEAIAELGRRALAGDPLDDLMEKTVADIARHLGVKMVKVLQLLPDAQTLLLRAGIGWSDGLVGHARLDTRSTSQAYYALQRASPVIVEDFASEKRFAIPPLLRDHNVKCGMTVIIGPVVNPWGALGAHHDAAADFTVDDVHFLEAVANTLWLAIEKHQAREAVEAERRELRGLADALPLQLSIISPDERYIFTNHAYHEWGRSPAEVEGMYVRDLLGEKSYRTAKPYIAEVLRGVSQRYELSVPRPDGSEPIKLTTYAPRRNASGELDGFYAAVVDITAQKKTEQALIERTAQYETIGKSIPYGVWVCDADGKLTYISQSFLDLVGRTFDEIRNGGWEATLEPGTAEETRQAWRRCVAEGRNWEWEHRYIGQDGNIYTILALGRPIRSEAGEIISWAGLNLDITKRKQDEERTRVISAELDHRVKNILATVSSMVRMTGRSARALREYQRDLEARIQAMARAHSTLANGSWTGMHLAELVQNELTPYSKEIGDRVTTAGPKVLLVPEAAQSLSLAIHELATNAAKYGALSVEAGLLTVEWDIARRDAPALTINWREHGLKNVQPPPKKGFGSMVIADVVRAQLGAEVTVDFQPTGLICHLRLPEKWYRRN